METRITNDKMNKISEERDDELYDYSTYKPARKLVEKRVMITEKEYDELLSLRQQNAELIEMCEELVELSKINTNYSPDDAYDEDVIMRANTLITRIKGE